MTLQEALRVTAECVNSRKLSNEVLEQPEIMRYLLFSMPFCPDMMEMVLDAIQTRFRNSLRFSQVWFESCEEIVCLNESNKSQSGHKSDFIFGFLANEKIKAKLPNIKHRAFDTIEFFAK